MFIRVIIGTNVMIDDNNRKGHLLRRAIESDHTLDLNFEWILKSDQVEVYYLHKEWSPDRDHQYYMITSDDILIKIAVTGEPLSIHKIVSKGRKRNLETVLERDPHGTYHLHKRAFPVNGIRRKNRSGEQLLELLIDYIAETAKTVINPKAKGTAKLFRVLAYDSLVARFNFLQTMQTLDDIIPDQSPRTVVVKAGEGCPNKCVYCKLSNVDFEPYSIDQFIKHLKETKEAHLRILGREGIRTINEGFVNISDVLLLDIFKKQGKTDLTALKAARLMRQYFPWLQKIGSFVGTVPALQLSEDRKGNYHLNGRNYSSNFFRRLCDNDRGIVRLYLGLETAHTQGSYLLEKYVTYEQKKLAAQLILDALIGLKVIVHLGVLGKGFYYYNDRLKRDVFVPWYKATDETIRWINEVQPYRVMESVWQDYGNLPIDRLIKEGKIIPYDNPSRQIEIERSRLRRNVNVNWKLDPAEVIEKDYERFLPPQKRRLVIVH